MQQWYDVLFMNKMPRTVAIGNKNLTMILLEKPKTNHAPQNDHVLPLRMTIFIFNFMR